MDVVLFEPTKENAYLPKRATLGAFGHDLAVVGRHSVPPHTTVIIPTGLRLAQPLPTDEESGLAMLILPRSSLALKYGLIVTNSPGLIDADYTGEIGVIVHNISDSDSVLDDGMRIAQAVFVRLVYPAIGVGFQDDRAKRGGFGSTGA